MISISHEGNECLLAEWALDGNECVFASLMGTEAATRAVSAALAGRKRVDVNDQLSLCFAKHGHYKLVHERIATDDGPTFRRTYLHPYLTNLASGEHCYLFQDNGGIPSQFWPRLARFVKIPKHKSWMPWMWEDGQEEHTHAWCTRVDDTSNRYGTTKSQPLVLLPGNGVRVWRMALGAHVWHAVLRDHFGWNIELHWDRERDSYVSPDSPWWYQRRGQEHSLYYGDEKVDMEVTAASNPYEVLSKLLYTRGIYIRIH